MNQTQRIAVCFAVVWGLFGCARQPSASPTPLLAVRTTVDASTHYRVLIAFADQLGRAKDAPTVFIGELLVLAAGLATPDAYISCAPTWRSLRPEIATVDAEGRVRGVAAGAAMIAVDCDGIEGDVTIRVLPHS
jgi:hypothetical protein